MDTFIRTFIDKQSRSIDLGIDGYSVVAEFNGAKIGSFDFDVFDSYDCNDILTLCDLKKDYQRSGIGTEIIQIAEDIYGEFCIVDHFAEEGAKFLNYCKEKGYLKLNHKKVKDERF